MRILLINPNRYHYPPVIPVGLEYLAGALVQNGHEVSFLDLCFAEDPDAALRQAFLNSTPDAAGITIRQVDTVLYHNNEFFLESIRHHVQLVKSYNIPVILGGAGFSIMPESVLQYTGADYGIAGPGEQALIRLLDQLEKQLPSPALLDGYRYFTDTTFPFPRQILDSYAQYLEKEGVAGFRTQIGCTGSCFFCVEKNKPLIFHQPEAVGRETAALKQKGYDRFHLCDSEFNLNLDHCLAVCRSLIRQAGGIHWALYMKPQPFSGELFRLLQESGAHLVTLSLDLSNAGLPPYNLLGDFFRLAAEHAIDVMIDLSLGAPGEDPEQAARLIAFLDTQPVKGVGVNYIYRVYPGTELYNAITGSADLEQYLLPGPGMTDLLRPVFFRYFPDEVIARLTAGRPRFRIEGLDKAANYQRNEHLM